MLRFNPFLWSFLLCSFPLFSQVPVSQATDVPFITSLNEAYGTSDKIIHGQAYLPSHPLANNHPFFISSEWVSSTLFIRGEAVADVMLAYNLELDRPVLQYKPGDGSTTYLILSHTRVDSFYLGDHSFASSLALGLKEPQGGYYEQLFTGNISLVQQHEKFFIATYSAVSPNGSYGGRKPALYLIHNGQKTPVSDKRSFLSFFEAHGDAVKNYMRTEKITYKRATPIQLHLLMQYCNALP